MAAHYGLPMGKSGMERSVTVLEARRLGETYPALLRYVEDNGELLPSRVGSVREVETATLVLAEPEWCVVGRQGMNTDFMDLEIEMLLAGVYNAELVHELVPRAAEMVTPLTAYGPRIVRQLPRVEAELLKSPLSRRAVVYVGREDDLQQVYTDSELRAGEMPCTCHWQFLIRRGVLDMVVYMRSWDAVWGLSYDVPCFVAVQMAMAQALNIEIGKYIHHAGSLHIYERHWGFDAWDEDMRLELSWLGNSIAETRTAALALLKEREILL